MSGTKSMMATALVTLAAAVALVVIAGSSAGTTAGRAAGSCLVPHGAGPGYDASIGNADNGKAVCVHVGERLLVLLSAPSPSAPPWRPIVVSPSGLLRPAPLTLMLARGATAANLRAVRRGRVVLSSQRPGCSPAGPGEATCDVIELWKATIIVRPAAA